MRIANNWLICLLMGGSLLIAGCGGGDEEKTGAETSGSANPASASNDSAEKGSDQAATADTPDAAMMQLVRGFQDQNPGAVWDFLPASYQKDVNDLIHLFANSMDQELHAKGFSVASKLVNVLKTKKEFILSAPSVAQGLSGAPIDQERLNKDWDVLIGVLETIVKSDISDLDKLKAVDGGEYLRKTGGQLMKQLQAASKSLPNDPYETELMATLGKLSAKTVSVDGDSATVELTDAEGSTKTEQMVRVEGKWIPAEMANGWVGAIADIKSGLETMPAAVAENKQQVLGALTMAEGLLTQLEQAETQEQFNATIEQAMLPVMMMVGGMLGGGGDLGGPAPVAEDGVRVVVIGLEEDDQDKLDEHFKNLMELAAAEEGSFTSGGGQALIDLRPVKDVAAFAEKIKIGEVVDVDATERTITVIVAEPASDDAKPEPGTDN